MWEGFFADAYGTGEATYLTVKGMQESGVITTAKHYMGYEQETFRYEKCDSFRNCIHVRYTRNPYGVTESYSVFPKNVQSPISSNFDDKATHEVSLSGSPSQSYRLMVPTAVFVELH